MVIMQRQSKMRKHIINIVCIGTDIDIDEYKFLLLIIDKYLN